MEDEPDPDPEWVDYGPLAQLKLHGAVISARYCYGVELWDIWIPPGWYDENGDIVDGPIEGWRLIAK